MRPKTPRMEGRDRPKKKAEDARSTTTLFPRPSEEKLEELRTHEAHNIDTLKQEVAMEDFDVRGLSEAGRKAWAELAQRHTGKLSNIAMALFLRHKEFAQPEGRIEYSTISSDDLFQEGLLAIPAACRTFDSSKGNFLRHVVIRALARMLKFTITRGLPNVYLPAHAANLARKLDTLIQKELAERGELTEDAARSMYDSIHSSPSFRKYAMAAEDVAEGQARLWLDRIKRATLLNTLFEQLSPETLERTADQTLLSGEAPHGASPEEEVLVEERRRYVRELVDALPPRTACIMRAHYGIHTGRIFPPPPKKSLKVQRMNIVGRNCLKRACRIEICRMRTSRNFPGKSLVWHTPSGLLWESGSAVKKS